MSGDPQREFVGLPVQAFADGAHPPAEEERDRPRYGRPEHQADSAAFDQPRPVLFPAIAVTRKSGAEPFHAENRPLGFDLLSFWQWAASDVANNTLRGLIAEYLVAQAIGVANGLRTEWNRYDLKTAGGTTIEVKSAAYLQSWAQAKLSSIAFSVPPTTGWDAVTNLTGYVRQRQSDVYVFALLCHREKTTLDPLNVEQWQFFVLGTKALNTAFPTHQSVGLRSLFSLKPAETTFASLGITIEQVAAGQR